MTHRDESAKADADLDAPSTRRSRREGEREAAHRALYADAPQTPSSMRVVDGGSPIYRTRREMRESAARLARDLPVIVEPRLEHAAPEAVEETSTVVEPRATGRRARRAVAEATPQASTDVGRAASSALPAVGSRRARRASAPMPSPERPSDERVGEHGVDETPRVVATQPAPAAPVRPAAEVSRDERREARPASTHAAPSAVATVLGGEPEHDRESPRREARPSRPVRVSARRPVAHAPVVRPSRRARSGAARKVVQRLAAAGVLLSIGSFVAVTSLPAQAFSPAEESTTTGAYGDVEVEQQLEISSDSGAHGAEEPTSVLTRDDFGVDDALASARLEPDELASLQAVADAEPIGPYFGGDPAMPNTWSQLETSYTQSPFPSLAEVPVSSGFSFRWGSFHGGVDLVPGAGTPIYPIANGVVIAVWQGDNPGGGGYQVIVEHNVDGQYIQAWYPHMQAGSIQVEPGQVVDVTTQLGAVGSTGRSTGAHLHLEIKNSDYVSMDPLAWLATRERILEPS